MRLKGIKKVTAKGHAYYYHRATGQRFKTDPAAAPAAFAEEAAKYDRQANGKATKAAKTLGNLIGAYRASPEYRGLKPRTREDYDAVLDWLKPIHAGMLDEFTPEFVIGRRDKAEAARKRRFANYLVQVLSLLFNWGIPRGWLRINPAAKVPKLKRPKGARNVNRPWSDEERAVVYAEATGGMLKAVSLGMFAGLAESDMVRWPWTGYTGARIVGTRGKNDGPVNVVAHPQLRAVLDATPPAARKGVIVRGINGRPYSVEGFRTMFFRFLRRLESEGKIGPGLTFHGLRHTVGKALAESWAGASSRTIGAAIGDKSEAMGKLYSEAANLQANVDTAYAMAEQKMAVKLENPVENRHAKRR